MAYRKHSIALLLTLLIMMTSCVDHANTAAETPQSAAPVETYPVTVPPTTVPPTEAGTSTEVYINEERIYHFMSRRMDLQNWTLQPRGEDYEIAVKSTSMRYIVNRETGTI